MTIFEKVKESDNSFLRKRMYSVLFAQFCFLVNNPGIANRFR